jgi:hypothetical protein
MSRTDPSRRRAHHLLLREAALAEQYAYLYCAAVSDGDRHAARHWNHEYRLSSFRCRALSAALHPGDGD